VCTYIFRLDSVIREIVSHEGDHQFHLCCVDETVADLALLTCGGDGGSDMMVINDTQD
jgi:hypothetical protein